VKRGLVAKRLYTERKSTNVRPRHPRGTAATDPRRTARLECAAGRDRGAVPTAPIAFLRDLLAPPRCATCAAPCLAEEALCGACRAELARARGGSGALAGVGPVTWSAPYEGVPRALVAALKFGGGLRLARLAGAAVAACLADPLPGWAVVAVPPAPARRRRRGYDAAELIAAEVGALLDLPIAAPLARADGPRQVGRPRSERRSSPPRVRPVAVAPERVLLVDDVLTTGATLAASAASLRAAGCAQVRAAVFARAARDPHPGA
jgi:predicted amidophosphoribosyltransferase